MANVAQEQDTYAADFERLECEALGGKLSWLLPVQKAAIARFAQVGFPTTRDEEWRYTNVTPIARTAYRLADPDAVEVTVAQLEPVLGWETDCVRLVFVNGRYAPDLSSVDRLPDGVTVSSFVAAADGNREVLETHLTRHAAYQDQAFTALNTAFIEDGALVHVPKGTVMESSVHLVFVSAVDDRPAVAHPRVLIVAERESQVAVAETYFGLGREACFTNAVTEIVAGESAVVDHYKIERETEHAHHVSTLHVHQYRSSNVTSHNVSLGGVLVRNDVHALLDDEGCECTLNGLYVADGSQHVDNHLRVEHVKPHCDSREFYKGVLDGKARGVFSGRIVVHEDAQKTDAKQTNMSLLLSEDAVVDTKPQLEIFADDVKCTHGATIGQVDEDAIFYLRSRGIDKESARGLLVFAFVAEAVGRVRFEPLRAHLRALLSARLPHGQQLGEDV